MFPVSTKMGGVCNAAPDTCKTPSPGGPVPVPYPNVAMLNQANPGTLSKKVKILNQPIVLKNTVITMSSGDEGGTAGGGVISSMIKGPVQFKKGSVKFKSEGQPVVFHTCTTGHNGTNANMPMGAQTAPSQSKVIVTS